MTNKKGEKNADKRKQKGDKNDQQELRQEGRQKEDRRQSETEGRQDGHNDQQQGKETEGKQNGHSDQQEGRQERRQRETKGKQKGDKNDQQEGRPSVHCCLGRLHKVINEPRNQQGFNEDDEEDNSTSVDEDGEAEDSLAALHSLRKRHPRARSAESTMSRKSSMPMPTGRRSGSAGGSVSKPTRRRSGSAGRSLSSPTRTRTSSDVAEAVNKAAGGAEEAAVNAQLAAQAAGRAAASVEHASMILHNTIQGPMKAPLSSGASTVPVNPWNRFQQQHARKGSTKEKMRAEYILQGKMPVHTALSRGILPATAFFVKDQKGESERFQTVRPPNEGIFCPREKSASVSSLEYRNITRPRQQAPPVVTVLLPTPKTLLDGTDPCALPQTEVRCVPHPIGFFLKSIGRSPGWSGGDGQSSSWWPLENIVGSPAESP